ncbi:aspartyl-phosphate phosphatase Spo0E family protein [Serpentinicella sp. ANB-PHB4]|uniref:aspartyl-phosphate phosphatase Spo0E family protein n=1 Tax=Serpentinicella sp. ANB-PHB4 TaxID=3074076 RepID=UPI00285EB925|nr:aspartyl-phosphate phosphatase Spo0E family protein [Serpentinicella sp. ANB-PHB4]MDR5658489.1 aspartyl-phosphate phosphatase Spo0E family protein [Serpentinicella sp. ANB-PHB4]
MEDYNINMLKQKLNTVIQKKDELTDKEVVKLSQELDKLIVSELQNSITKFKY